MDFCGIMLYLYYCVFTVNVIDGEKLMIRKISRLHMGSYLCVASNGVPPTRSKRINVTVHCECMIIIYCINITMQMILAGNEYY